MLTSIDMFFEKGTAERVRWLRQPVEPYIRGWFDGGHQGDRSAAAWIREGTADPQASWQTIGEGAITCDGSSTRAELVALALLQCAVVQCAVGSHVLSSGLHRYSRVQISAWRMLRELFERWADSGSRPTLKRSRDRCRRALHVHLLI